MLVRSLIPRNAVPKSPLFVYDLANGSLSFHTARVLRRHPKIAGTPEPKGIFITAAKKSQAFDRLFQLRVLALKAKLQDCGLPMSGNKPDLVNRLVTNLAAPSFPNPLPLSSPLSVSTDPAEWTLVSIDIGFRHLAFSVINSHFELLDWRTVDLASEHKIGPLIQAPWLTTRIVADFVQRSLPIPDQLLQRSKKVIYLVERQRFRTAGFKQIPDPVLFINLIEPLLYLELSHRGIRFRPSVIEPPIAEEGSADQRNSADQPIRVAQAELSQPTDQERALVTPVSPQSVSHFFGLNEMGSEALSSKLAADPSDSTPTEPVVAPIRSHKARTRNRQVKKKFSVVLVSDYLNGSAAIQSNSLDPQESSPSSALSSTAAPVKVDGQGPLLMGLIGHKAVPQLRLTPELHERFLKSKKKDDLSDCLLQALAWVAWQANRAKEAHALFMDSADEPESGGGGKRTSAK
ncbi:hypothetical protein H4R33_003127 [Dimargaris cristalligena]|uniref:SAP domain-containing protein n=1 Tax=Dimargaris cristalligena TaxID=215637 RepID=A0A4Q0A1H2_9FUNG|nr:hypothetical protein H4R33_003127 [Dimargaris cristalligena]RKP39628.1 hypothetical protein BJ085DRAFT_36644 [Dimargaris cristalligena]|eukprot:RKP39628.1 hypothetical protein BJ085DRAFT_36644 [Dimargaris cristalligena]